MDSKGTDPAIIGFHQAVDGKNGCKSGLKLKDGKCEKISWFLLRFFIQIDLNNR